MSVDDQCKLFSKMDLFISPHGGALANSLCMKPGSSVIEVAKRCVSNEDSWMRQIQDALDIRSRTVKCGYTENKSTEVDPDEMMYAVTELFD